MISYHYTSSIGIFGIINTSQLHCTSASFLNDPTEQKYFNSILKEVILKSSDCKSIYKTLYNESVESHILNPFENYVVSFCKKSDSLSMWSHYANGNGYNLGFNIDSIIERNSPGFFSIRKVDLIYSKDTQINLIENYILSHKDYSEKYLYLEDVKNLALESDDKNSYDEANYEQDNYLIEFSTGLLELKLKFKHEAFKGEEEVRIVLSQDESKGLESSHKITSNGVIIEYVTLSVNLSEDLVSVNVHPINSDLHSVGMNRFLNTKVGYKKINVSKSEIPFRLI